MNYTFDDLKEKLKKETELDLLEILDLSSEELVDFLSDEIHDRQQQVRDYYDEDEEDTEENE